MFVSVRVPTDRDLAIDVLPSLELGPLEPDAAAKLMASIIDGVVDERARRRVMNDAQGNPLAIVELTRELTLRAADAALLPRPLSLDRRLEARFLRQIHELPPATQRLLLTAASDERSAEIYYQEALTLLGESAGDYHRARAQLVYGEWLRRQKRRRDAREQLRSAVATFEQEGAIGFADRARGELIATGERARKRVDETRDDLTPQEMRIALLAAEGDTNPEIAAKVFLSVSTVEYHLSHVYRKLGVSSRRALASSSRLNKLDSPIRSV